MKKQSQIQLSILVLFLLGCAVALTLFLFSPPKPLPVDSPATNFSAERATRDLEFIARKPHPMGVSQAHADVREYLLTQIRALGLEPQVQDTFGQRHWGSESGYVSGGFVENILTRLPGTNPKDAILVMAHYDSTPGAPGGGDNGAGVVILLELLRALRANPPLLHDVIFLFTDGEEPGTFGAHAFISQHPWFNEVSVVINLDGIGDGPPGLAQTSQRNGIWIQAIARNAERPTYLSLPVHLFSTGDSDLIPFKQQGVTAAGFATASVGQEIHTMLDRPEIVNPGTIQHIGNHLLGLLSYLANQPTLETEIPDQTFFPVLGRLVHYPSGWAIPLAGLAGLCSLGTLFFGLKKRIISWKGSCIGFLVSISSIIFSIGADVLLWKGIKAFHSEYEISGVRPHLTDDALYTIGFIGLALAIVAGLIAIVRVKISSVDLTAGALVFWLPVSLASAILVPETSYLGTWVLLINALALLLALTVQSKGYTPHLSGLGFLASAVLVTFLWVPVITIAFLSLGFTIPWLLFGVAVLWFVSLLPILDWIGYPMRWSFSVAAVLAAIGFLLAGHFLVGRSSPPPLVNSIGYWLDAESNQADWVAFIGGYRTDFRTTTALQVAFPDEMDERQSHLLVNPVRRPYTEIFPQAPQFSVLASEAPLLNQDGPDLAVISDEWVNERRVIHVELSTSMHDRLYIIIPNTPIQAITLPYNARTSLSGSDGLWMRLDGLPLEGSEICFEFNTSDPIQIYLVEEKTGLPSFPGLVTQPEPGTMRSPGEFLQGDATDFTAIYRIVEISGSTKVTQ